MSHHFNIKEHSYSFKSVCAVTIGDSASASGFEINTTGTWKSDGTTTQRSVATNPAFTAVAGFLSAKGEGRFRQEKAGSVPFA
jgi:hypothetical protein